ncbi:hypothetical protein [Rhizobium sp. J15]|uniref:hypothetical protein n=1 Tax=Rhizobium sp. J15 TaxID=2035450 RepID=UPI001142AE15|nr:hypothetical protein [Rhizobium sp. J15]
MTPECFAKSHFVPSFSIVETTFGLQNTTNEIQYKSNTWQKLQQILSPLRLPVSPRPLAAFSISCVIGDGKSRRKKSRFDCSRVGG